MKIKASIISSHNYGSGYSDFQRNTICNIRMAVSQNYLLYSVIETKKSIEFKSEDLFAINDCGKRRHGHVWKHSEDKDEAQ